MESIGQRFKAARERKRVSLSQAAAKTRIKVQVLEAMEQDDFSKIPAPAYSRGFIRMYAEFLGLESGPLVKEFNELGQAPKEEAAPKRQPPPKKVIPEKSENAEPGDAAAEPGPGTVVSTAGWRRAAMLVCGILLVVIVAAQFTRGPSKEKAEKPEAPRAPKRDLHAIVAEPPEPYIDVSLTNSP